MLTESLVLSMPGGDWAVGLAWLAVNVLDAIQARDSSQVSADHDGLARARFYDCLMLATSLLFGIVPALSAAGIHIQEALKSAGLTHSAARGAARIRKILVVGGDWEFPSYC